MRALRRIAVVACLLALQPALAEGAARPAPWATINVCRNLHLGVRGQMPGDGTKEQMYVRFIAQYRSPKGWQRLAGGRSPWLRAGSARFLEQQTGYTFTIVLAKGSSALLRGLAQFEWRSGSRIVRRAYAVTERGHSGTRGAQPRSFSAARCRLRG